MSDKPVLTGVPMPAVVVGLKLTLTEPEFEKLWAIAGSRMNYLRENPRNRWTRKEKLECVRRYVVQLSMNALSS